MQKKNLNNRNIKRKAKMILYNLEVLQEHVEISLNKAGSRSSAWLPKF